MIGSVETITPAMAQAILAQNIRNRPLTEGLAQRYAEDMRQGRWETNGQGLIIASDGSLLDGQHRLTALIMADMPLEMFVVRGVPPERFETMDSGRARTVSDVLGANNYANATALAAIARLAWNYIAGAGITYTPSKGTMLDFIRQNHFLTEVTTLMVANRPPVTNAPMGAVMFVATAGASDDVRARAHQFIVGVASGENLAKGDPRLTLREWFYSQRLRDRGVVRTEVCFAAVARAWNAFADARELTVIKPPPNANKRTLPIIGFDPEYFSDVTDIAIRLRDVQMANLSKAQSHRKTA